MMTRVSLALAAVLASAACGGGVSTNTDWDPSFAFTPQPTYDWIDSQGEVDNITSGRIRTSVDAQLDSRGFTQSSSNPDLVVSYQVTTNQRSSFNTINTGWGGGYRWGGWGMSMGTSRTTETVWQEGTLILGIFDTTTKNMVWTGTATTDLDQGLRPEERQQRLDNAVNRMMQDFPWGS